MVADGDPVSRMVIRDALRGEEGVVVVAQAADGVEAVELALHYRPELLLTELTLPRMCGMDVLMRIRAEAPEVGVVFLSTIDSPASQMQALLAGARGFLSKQQPLASVVETLGALRPDEAAVSANLTSELVRALCALPRAGTGVRPILSSLTQREWEILDMLSAGETIDEIAETLGVVADTVRSHLKHARAKLRVSSDDDVVGAANRLVQTKVLPRTTVLPDPRRGLPDRRITGSRERHSNGASGAPPLQRVSA